MTSARPTGDDLVEMLAALANPIRLRIVATLAGGRDYVSHLAREIGVSRPLLHMHLQRLAAARPSTRRPHPSGGRQACNIYGATRFARRPTPPALAPAGPNP